MAKLMYPGANRAGKSDQPQRVNREGKGDQPQRVNRAEKVNPVRGANVPKPKPKPSRTAEGATVPVKPKPKPEPKPKPKPKPNVIRTTVAERTTPVPKPKSKPAPAFKANFKGAAPSAMQARGGARINRGGGLLGLIKRKFGK
jgi:outer membrane biosynthesis protein TonB